jgi:ectoine hydroxylase-related dioxygenase (phytanoyl-CoA dioxygenase family)
MTFWIPLQNTNEQNGCMRFLSASHRQDVVEHRLVDPTVEMPDFEVADPTCIDPARVHIVPLPLGSATVHSCRTLHSAFCNRSPSPRKAYTMGFGFKPTVRPHRRRFTWNPRMYPLESVSP